MTMRPFSIRLTGEFHPFTLYDHDGRECDTLREAALTAELIYGSDWAEVFNGDEGADRDTAVADGLLRIPPAGATAQGSKYGYDDWGRLCHHDTGELVA